MEKMILFIFQLFWKDEIMKMKKRVWERWQTLMHLKQAVVVGLQASVTARALPTTLSKTGSKVCWCCPGLERAAFSVEGSTPCSRSPLRRILVHILRGAGSCSNFPISSSPPLSTSFFHTSSPEHPKLVQPSPWIRIWSTASDWRLMFGMYSFQSFPSYLSSGMRRPSKSSPDPSKPSKLTSPPNCLARPSKTGTADGFAWEDGYKIKTLPPIPPLAQSFWKDLAERKLAQLKKYKEDSKQLQRKRSCSWCRLHFPLLALRFHT